MRRWLEGKPRGIAVAIALMALILFGSAGAAAWFVYDVTAGLPGAKEIHGLGDMAQATTILDAHDTPVFTIFKEQRIEVPLEKVSPELVKAVVSVEDQRFFDHAGVDLIRVAAAALRNFREGRRAEGGSTITQQLARQSFLSRDKTYRRKLKEAILAARIEREFTKQQILELYLNKVYFGDGLYGVEAASRGYFGRHANELTLDQAALLAGLVQSPSSYAPTVNLDRAVSRRNVVLQTMVDSRSIDAKQAEQARLAPVRLTNTLEMKESFGLYFKEQVRRDLVERFGASRIIEGGLRVYTTLDPALQRAAEQVVENGVDAIESRRGYPHPTRAKAKGRDYLQGALVALDPATGAVRALVGGRDFGDSRFNRATQAHRQAGSAYKPFVYTAALEAGYSPASVITNLNDPIATPQGGWVPEDGHSTASSMTMRSALKISSNRAAVQMLSTVGIPAAVSYAQKLNVGTPPSVPSLALGAGDVTLLQLTSAYSVFASEGMLHPPVFIRRVEDADGKVLYTNPGKASRAISESSAFLMSSMLADVINAGTAAKARQAGFTLPAAGKTGTTNDGADAWFVGYTPDVTATVWIGFDEVRPILGRATGGRLAAPVWGRVMKSLYHERPIPRPWVPPADVASMTIDPATGFPLSFDCVAGDAETRRELFRRDAMPTPACPFADGAGHVPPGALHAASLSDDEAPEAGAGGSVEPAHSYVPTVTRAQASEEPQGPGER